LLTITAPNAHTGGTQLNGGRLRVGHNAAPGTGTLAIAAGTSLSSDGATARTISAPVSLGGSFTLGNATDTGAVHLSGPVTLAADTSVTVESASNMDVSGVIGGTGHLEYKRATSPSALWTLTNAGNTVSASIRAPTATPPLATPRTRSSSTANPSPLSAMAKAPPASSRRPVSPPRSVRPARSC
jgi:fibronectin-binding autotransporter adhesin